MYAGHTPRSSPRSRQPEQPLEIGNVEMHAIAHLQARESRLFQELDYVLEDLWALHNRLVGLILPPSALGLQRST